MTRKDYIAISKAIKEARKEFDSVDLFVSALVSKLSRYFSEGNMSFRDELFRRAIYGKGKQ